MRKTIRSLLSVLLCAAMLLSSVCTAFAVPEKAPLQAGLISDIHYFGKTCAGNYSQAFLTFAEKNANERYETPALLESALAALTEHARENGMKYVFIPGDMTANGEYDNHAELAARLEQFEADTGIQVIVTNGNHDINNYNGFTFENGKKEKARITTPEDFREIYKNLGYDLAYHTYTPKTGKAGGLSYSVQLDGGYRLLVLDVNKYSADATDSGEDSHQTEGAISDGLMEWALDEIADAKAHGETPIGMEHHSIVQHFDLQNSLFKAFLVDDWQECAETFADAGLAMMFTGHMHDTSITDWVSDDGNVIYDVSSPSLTMFPNYFREIRFDNTGDTFSANVQTFDVDCVLPVTVGDKTYDVPFSRSFSFDKTFDSSSVYDLAMRYLSETLDGFLDAVEREGSIVSALKTRFGLDLESLIGQYVDIRLGSIGIFTTENVMSFLDDLDKQLQEKVLIDRENVYALVRDILQRISDLQVSDLPCTKYIDTYGFGDPNKPGTFGDAAYSVLVTLYAANQTIEDDPFLQDVLDFFENRQGANALWDMLYDLLLNDLVQDKLLGHLDFNIDTLFPCGTLGHISMTLFDNFLSLIFRGDKSYTNVINSVLGLGIIPDMDSINGIADYFIEEYITQSQLDSIGHTFASMIGDLLVDQGDGEDLNRTITPGKREVVATRDNYRLPSIVTVTLGEDAATERNISWYTKFSVTGSDIEIVPYSEHPVFTGTPTTKGVDAVCERHDRFFPGVDLGIIGFMDTKQPLNRHIVRLTGLTPGTKYCYRVGDASRGWWSEAGVLETADNSDAVTFLHIADPQPQNAKQYERFHTVLNAAFAQYPDAKLIVSSGDQVDSGTNVNQWKWLTDVSSDRLMQTVLMPTTGNQEKEGAVLDENFILPNVPEQDTDSGVYYDYDYNNVHFMVLNTNDTTSKKGLSETQLAWLKDSAESSDAQWKIVVLHKATYSNGSHFDDKEVVAMRKQFKRLFPELDIDMVLEGHDHVYLRTDSMYNNFVTKSKTESVTLNGRDYTAKVDPYGTFYVISGCSGVKNYAPKDPKKTDKQFPRAEALCDTMLPIFSAIQIKGSKLYFDAYTVDENGNTVRVDAFAIEKTGAEKCLLSGICNKPNTLGSVENLEDVSALVYAQDGDLYEMDLIPDKEHAVDMTPKPGSGTVIEGGDSGNTSGNVVSGGSSNTPGTNTPAAGGANGGSTNAGKPSANGMPNSTPGNSTQKPQSSLQPGTVGGGNSVGTANGTNGTVSGSHGAANGTPGSTSGSGAGTPNNGTAASPVNGTYGQRIPKLGGETPVVTVCVLFGAAIIGMLTVSRKKEEND